MPKHIHVHLGAKKTSDADSGEGRWVTINGAHVLIKNGKISKGPPALVGKSHAEAHQAAGAEHLAKHDEAKKKGDNEQAEKHLKASAAHTNAGEAYKQGLHGNGDLHAKEAEKHHAAAQVVHTQTAKPKPAAHHKLHTDAGKDVAVYGSKKHLDEHNKLLQQYGESKADWERQAVNRKIERNMVDAKQHHSDKAAQKARDLSAAAHKSGKKEDHEAAHAAAKHAHAHPGGMGYAKRMDEMQALMKGHKNALDAQAKKANEPGPIGKALAGMHEVDPKHPQAVKHYNSHKAHTEDLKEGGKDYRVHKHGSFEGPIFAVEDLASGKQYRTDKFAPFPAGLKKKPDVENVSGITKPSPVGTPSNPADPSKKASGALPGAKKDGGDGPGEAAPAKVLGELKEHAAKGEADKLSALTKHPNKLVASQAQKHLDEVNAKSAKSAKAAEGAAQQSKVQGAHSESAAYHKGAAEQYRKQGDAQGAALHEEMAGHHEHMAKNANEDHSKRGARVKALQDRAKEHAAAAKKAGTKVPAPHVPGKAPSGPAKGSAGGGAVQGATEAVKGLKDAVKKAGDASDPDPKKQS